VRLAVGHYAALIAGAALAIGSLRLWSSEAFLDWTMRSYARGRGDFMDDANHRTAQRGVRGVLIIALIAGTVLVVLAVWSI
jgi:hypothetical protein